MEYNQLSFADAATNQIRSHYKTLSRYLQTSMALHNRPVQSVYSLAVTRHELVHALADAHPDDPEVQRWTKKFDAFIDQHDLLEPRVGD